MTTFFWILLLHLINQLPYATILHLYLMNFIRLECWICLLRYIWITQLICTYHTQCFTMIRCFYGVWLLYLFYLNQFVRVFSLFIKLLDTILGYIVLSTINWRRQCTNWIILITLWIFSCGSSVSCCKCLMNSIYWHFSHTKIRRC